MLLYHAWVLAALLLLQHHAVLANSAVAPDTPQEGKKKLIQAEIRLVPDTSSGDMIQV